MSVLSQSKQNVRILDLRLPEGFNVRSEPITDEERDMLAASIEAHGLVHDISVEEVHYYADNLVVYVVTDGFGRASALRHLLEERGWDSDTRVTVNVVTYGERVDPALRNLVENEHRRPIKSADKAKRLYELANGLCPDPRGGYVPKVSVKRLATELQAGEPHIRELIRAWGKACGQLRNAWLKEDVRTDHVRDWCKLPEGQQLAKLHAHLNAGAEPEAASADAEEEDEEERSSHVRPPTKRQMLEQADLLTERMKNTTDRLRVYQMEAARNALLWAAGQTARVLVTDTNGGFHEQASSRATAER